MEYISIKPDKAEIIAEQLDIILSSYQIFCAKLKSFYWNVKGKNFYELRVKYDELYIDSLKKIDEVGDRILVLGHYPSVNVSECLKISVINEMNEIPTEQEMIDNVLLDIHQLLKIEKSCLTYATKNNDYATAAMLGRYIEYKEKVSWWFFTWLKI